MKKQRKDAGFSLIEIMVVVVIIGILASFIMPKIMDKPGESRIAKAQHDIQSIGSALDLYKLKAFNYPTTDEGLQALVGQQLDKLPQDPWGREYFYLSPGQHGDYDLYSYGADGKQGGEGENADINSWQ